MKECWIMKKIFLFLLIIINIQCMAQTHDDVIIEYIERMSDNESEENYDYSELVETYWSLIENPININSDDIDLLAELKFISIFQIENIKKYIKKYDDIIIIEELYEIEGLDDKSINLIKDIICFKDNDNHKVKIRDVLKYGKNKILMEVNQCLNPKKGYLNIDDSLLYENPNSIYLGSPQRLYLRYNYTYRNKIEAGLVMEKDPGEYIFRRNVNDSIVKLLGKQCYSGFDFFSFHLLIKDLWFIKTLAAGDYKISFGQGLTMGSGMAFVDKGGSLLRRSKKISASKSANESHYLRGIATTLEYNNIELSVFYSNKKRDANITAFDSLNNEILEISSLQQSGLHRTLNELLDRKAIRQQLYGMNLSYRNSNFQIGYTLHKTELSASLIPDNNIYNLFNFKGSSLANQGIDFYYIFDKLFLYGEVAMSDNRGLAGLAACTFQPAGYIDFTLLYRDYSKDYQCLYSNAFASGSKTCNENGLYFSNRISIAKNWRLTTSVDFHKSDWLKNNAHSPSHGYEFDILLNYQSSNNTLFFIEYRKKEKMKNTSNTNIFHRYLIAENNNMIRLHATYQLSERITLKNRVEYHFNTKENYDYNSYLIYQDILYNSIDRKHSLAFRYELFNAESGSVYAYENDVLYAFAVGGLSGKGVRTYIVGKSRLFGQVQVSSKIGFTLYDNKDEIGSGLECISNNWRADAKVQIIWSF